MIEYQWKIFWAGLDPVKDSEQSGIRPVIVISSEDINNSVSVVGVLPLTSMKEGRKIYPIEVFLPMDKTGLNKDSISMSHQIKVISKNRLIKKCGEILTVEIKEEIKKSIKTFLDLD
ncbi:MAG: type II toxin-antitoxin system PemK/MazF family toxin [Actinobacteria bacterium]|nr:type II toxin-antitoxin system PemK/MazF family toxin [Actinomycetota bacterium]